MAETSRSRLNSVHALVDEIRVRTGDETSDHVSSLWEKLQSHGLNDTDAWLCGALMQRLALAACAPNCKSSGHIEIIGKISQEKQSVEVDRVHIISAQCGALRLLHAVKPMVVRPHVNPAQFIPVVRQSMNLMDERKQREEVLKICRDVLIASDLQAEAQAICLEFLHDETPGIRLIAIEGLLALATSSRHTELPRSLVASVASILFDATSSSSPTSRVAALRLLRVVALQHKDASVLSSFYMHAMDRSHIVRQEVALSLRHFHDVASPNAIAQWLLKTPLDDGQPHVPTELVATGVLLSLLEDQHDEVREEASRSIVALARLCKPHLHVAALENAITAHADLVHVGASLSAKLTITLSLASLLKCHNTHPYAFTTEQVVCPAPMASYAPGWQQHVVVTALVYGVDDPTTLAIKILVEPDGSDAPMVVMQEVVPRDITWQDRRAWVVCCRVPVTMPAALDCSVKALVCVTSSQDQVQAMGPAVVVGVTRQTLPNMSPVHHQQQQLRVPESSHRM
ncbi:hypothetical protein DYB37_004493 [Aphanomyces astaci]|uniref:Clathrin/coatomer adaptor adaptin-like N-terminal domain-containing protein n=1 Tax=Aphanomyces astaci TaxID=112090 RepID=A0A3R7BMI7_APHAT|nr:hypothetical protein DYB35_004376 [Aphanomyces astaci]RHZ23631.1 hypothetical protein DYB37_004493 [Aphanomyces astaci]